MVCEDPIGSNGGRERIMTVWEEIGNLKEVVLEMLCSRLTSRRKARTMVTTKPRASANEQIYGLNGIL